MRSSKKAFWLPVISSSGTCMGMTMQVFFLFSAFISVSIVPLSPLSFLTLWSPWKLHIHLPWQDALFDAKISIQKAGGSFKRYASGQVKKIS